MVASRDDSPPLKQIRENALDSNEKNGIVVHSGSSSHEAEAASTELNNWAATTQTEEQEIANTNQVAPKDEKPYSAFSGKQKWFIVTMASAAAFFSPLSGQIYFPVLPILTETYHISQTLINVSVTTYMVFQGLAPSFMATFSDAGGRRLGYILAFAIYTAANIGLALQDSYPALLVLRCVQSAGSSGTVAFGYGVIADVVTTAERGKYFGPMVAGALTAPALGPTIGGLLTHYLGWRSVFWFLTIISGSYLIAFIVFMPETSRKLVKDGSIIPVDWWRQSVVQWVAVRRRLKAMSTEERAQYERQQTVLVKSRKGMRIGYLNPLGSFLVLRDPDAFCIILFISIAMFSNLVLMTSIATTFPTIYDLNVLQVGLCFLPLGVAASIAAIINGKILDWNYRRHAKRLGIAVDKKKSSDLSDFPIELCRLEPVFWSQFLTVATLLPYGWTLDKHAPLVVPLILQFIQGFCMVVASNSLGTLCADIYPGRVSTASAASNLMRCFLGAVGAATVDGMINYWGLGLTFVFTGCIMAAASGLLLIEKQYGMRWRQRRWTRLKLEKEANRVTRKR